MTTASLPDPGTIITYILIMWAVTYLLRLAPFVAIRQLRQSRVVEELGTTMPLGVMTALVIYCLKDVNPVVLAEIFPALIGVGITAILHLWRSQAMLSLVGGVAAYGISLSLFN